MAEPTHATTGVTDGLDENRALARLLEKTAALLDAQNANPFRVQAYRHAARELHSLERPVRAIHEEGGREGLEAIPRIGESLARAIETWLTTGTFGILARLSGDEAAERVLASVAGIGPELARRIHHELHVSTLEELEQAAIDGRLAKLPGIGPRRLQGIRDQLAARLARRGDGRRGAADIVAGAGAPDIAELIDVDREYRELVALDRLPKIAPRRFNPEREAWLPVLHTHRGDRHYTVLFSNTARAHELGRTDDWVVIYLDDGAEERQWTVVTERHGPMAGSRVVRGPSGAPVVPASRG